jgi:hypothetical protein
MPGVEGAEREDYHERQAGVSFYNNPKVFAST